MWLIVYNTHTLSYLHNTSNRYIRYSSHFQQTEYWTTSGSRWTRYWGAYQSPWSPSPECPPASLARQFDWWLERKTASNITAAKINKERNHCNNKPTIHDIGMPSTKQCTSCQSIQRSASNIIMYSIWDILRAWHTRYCYVCVHGIWDILYTLVTGRTCTML